jgi:hypothetical protein
MARRVLVLCALVAAVVAAPQQDDSIEEVNMRKFGAVVPISTLNVPATGGGIIYQTPLGAALTNGKFSEKFQNSNILLKYSHFTY